MAHRSSELGRPGRRSTAAGAAAVSRLMRLTRLLVSMSDTMHADERESDIRVRALRRARETGVRFDGPQPVVQLRLKKSDCLAGS